MPEAHWKELVQEKRKRQQQAIPSEWIIGATPANTLDVINIPETCGLLTAKEIAITNTGVGPLLAELATGNWSAVEVTTAFAKRAIIAHQLTNCLTEIFIERALKRARELDDFLKDNGRVIGPLHGLPVSLKDQIHVKGLESTMGYVSWIGKFATENAVLVDILESSGAILFVKTNVPQTLMWAETYNEVFGRTVNPHSRALTCGGSSGGEGALIAMKGAPLGIGSDIGGSIRIPSALCGIYGLRPSMGRVPYAGCANSLEGQESILSVLGPMSTTLEGVKIFMKILAAQRPWELDPMANKRSWDEEEYRLSCHGGGRSLCFGVIWDDGIMVPHPPVIRGLEITKRALIAAGHQVIDWKPLKHREIYNVGLGIFNAGSAEDYRVVTAPTGEPLLTTMLENPDPAQAMSRIRVGQGETTAYQLWQLHKKRRDLREEYLRHWNNTITITKTGRPVDAIIAPPAAYAAPPHGRYKDANYTTVWNVLDYSALCIPVTKVDPALDIKQPPHKFYDEFDEENYKLYDSALFVNAPVSVQLIGRSHEEEAVIAMSEIVDAALRAQEAKL
ncbi:hypothetical protein AX16_000480 [Volvariella volvacea WC 439]|nr:hypothetical protein AX16_000480 [Volvariella volvacea WC 439]